MGHRVRFSCCVQHFACAQISGHRRHQLCFEGQHRLPHNGRRSATPRRRLRAHQLREGRHNSKRGGVRGLSCASAQSTRCQQRAQCSRQFLSQRLLCDHHACLCGRSRSIFAHFNFLRLLFARLDIVRVRYTFAPSPFTSRSRSPSLSGVRRSAGKFLLAVSAQSGALSAMTPSRARATLSRPLQRKL